MQRKPRTIKHFHLVCLSLIAFSAMAISACDETEPEGPPAPTLSDYVGTWVNPSYQITLIIAADGTFHNTVGTRPFEGDVIVAADGSAYFSDTGEIQYAYSNAGNTDSLTMNPQSTTPQVLTRAEGTPGTVVGNWLYTEQIPLTGETVTSTFQVNPDYSFSMNLNGFTASGTYDNDSMMWTADIYTATINLTANPHTIAFKMPIYGPESQATLTKQ